MKALDEMKWEAFFLLDLFDYQKGNQNNMNSLVDGDIPLVSAKKFDNGYKNFVRPNAKKEYKGGCISLNLDGDGGAGLAYYQPYMMLVDSHVGILIPKFKHTKYNLLFVAQCISKQRDMFGHGHSINESRLRVYRLMLPVSSPHTPDYSFMDSYFKMLEKRQLLEYNDYMLRNEIKYKSTICIKDKQWKPFFLNDIFTIDSGVRLTKNDMIDGNTPFIGSSDSKNGITAFISNDNKSKDSNVLGVNYNGSVVENFYHPYKALFSDDVKRLHFRHFQDDKYAYLFVKQAILQQKCKFEYGYKFNGERMSRQQILLPVDDTGNVDYDFMSRYMRSIESAQLQKYIEKKLN